MYVTKRWYCSPHDCDQRLRKAVRHRVTGQPRNLSQYRYRSISATRTRSKLITYTAYPGSLDFFDLNFDPTPGLRMDFSDSRRGQIVRGILPIWYSANRVFVYFSVLHARACCPNFMLPCFSLGMAGRPAVFSTLLNNGACAD